jgi:thymidylate synthase ThyX
VTKTYSGHLSRQEPTQEEVDLALTDIVRTKLQNPLEMIHFTWLIEDVTRAFTHQIVRYRVGTSFVQESMRFIGMKGIYKVLAVHEAAKQGLDEFSEAARQSIKAYVSLLEKDVPGEFARGLLPTNILTSLFFDCSLRTLQGIMPQRLCCQAAAGEWAGIMRDMRKLIELRMGVEVSSLLRAPYELGQDCGYRASFDRPCIWQPEKRA